MIYELEKQNYKKVLPLVKSDNELSVFSVIASTMDGKIYVNDKTIPTAALIQTSECNMIAGDTRDFAFNEAIAEILDFWDTITPDSEEWCGIIPQIHPDKFIKKYQRRRYLLDTDTHQNMSISIPNGYFLEQAAPDTLRKCGYQNADKLLEWIENWGSDANFATYGVGAYIRNQDTIVSWSISDCAYKDKIAIGIHTDKDYRKKGFAAIVVNEVIRLCVLKGYKNIEWLCVDCNKGSIGVAEKAGFQLHNTYDSFAPYAPVENLRDLSEHEWEIWAKYFEEGAKSEARLLQECIYTYIKANNPQKVKELLALCPNKQEMETDIKSFISYLHTIGMASKFN
ncbi:MAG: GNAT family N-acetyltransferase [Lachnospiraceae bacterium]|nr:GNAT family N-acetyltransferase [Lachnospiraceae bacterium]